MFGMMMKTEEGIVTFNSMGSVSDHSHEGAVGDGKRLKLMYTSEFLKSFDKAPKPSAMISLEDLECDNKKIVRSKDSQVEKLRDKLEVKDNQIQQLRFLLLKVKELIMERKDDEALIKRVKDVFNENEEGRQLLLSDQPKKKPSKEATDGLKVPLLKLPEIEPSLDSISPTSPSSAAPIVALTPTGSSATPAPLVPTSPTSVTPADGSPTPTSPTSKHSVRSPRRKGSPNEPTSPGSTMGSAPQPQTAPLPSPSAKQVSLRSPRRTTIKTPTTVTATVPAAPSASSTSKNIMKRSPSMPVINNNDRQRAEATQAQLKLQKKTKSTEDATAELKAKKAAEDPGKKSKAPDSVSPRKVIKKSVSMSSLVTEQDRDKAAAALKCTSLEEIVGQIYPLTKYQAGCRFLQKKLEEQPDPQHVTLVFNEVFDHLIELMTDPYGQYLVPKLMKYCDSNQRQMIVTKIAPKIVTFACHTYGIHGVQKILEFLTDDQVNTFVDVIRPNVILLAKDNKGNYLIQSFLKQFPPERNQFIYDAITDNCVEVATHKVGCTLINRCVDYANEQQLSQLGTRVTSFSLQLVQDQYGNYVVQHLLSTKPMFAGLIIKGLLGHIAELSVQKFSSNVIEKCLQVATADQYADIIKEITDANLLELLQDRYANFVIQTALDVADDQQHAKLVKMILPFIHQIKTPYVMHIQKKILQV